MAKVKMSGPRLVGYARISTAEQILDLQVDALRKAGVLEENIHEEQVSGIASRRPKLELAMMDARRGDTFVVWKLDRVGRSLLDLLHRLKQLEDGGVAFRSLTEGIDTSTPGGRLIMHVMGSLAQFERDIVVERTKAGMKAARERGRMPGQPRIMTAARLKEAAKMLRKQSVAQVAEHFRVSDNTIYTYFPRTVLQGLRANKS